MDMMDPPKIIYRISTKTQNVLNNSIVFLDNDLIIMYYCSNIPFTGEGGGGGGYPKTDTDITQCTKF